MTVDSSAGILYVGYHHFVWATLAGLFSFHLGPLYLVHAFLLALPALWLVRRIGGPSGAWVALIALSSPLAAFLSLQLLPLWWMSFLGGALALWLVTTKGEELPGNPALTLVGLVMGYLGGVYPSLAILTAGVVGWLISRHARLKHLLVFLGANMIGMLPFLSLLALHWDQLTPQVQVGQTAFSWADLIGGFFRYTGLPSSLANGRVRPLGAMETILTDASFTLWLILVAATVWSVVCARRAKKPLPSTVLLAIWTYGSYIVFTLITRTETWHHQAANLWWVPAMLIPWIVETLASPRLRGLLLGAFVAFNVLILSVLFGPRLVNGTSGDPQYTKGDGLGPAWWMQEQLVAQIAKRAERELCAGDTSLLTVRCANIQLLPHSLPRLFRMQHPELRPKVEWVPEGARTCVILVADDTERRGRLRLYDWSPRWVRPAAHERRAVHILIPNGSAVSGQVAIDIDRTWAFPVEMVDLAGTRLPIWLDPDLTSDGRRRIWVKIPPVPSVVFRAFLYSGGAPTIVDSDPSQVFTVFEGFDRPLDAWIAKGRAEWMVSGGRALLTLPPAQEDTTSATLLFRGAVVGSAIIEAKIRYVTYPTLDDVGLVFAASPVGSGQIAYLHGQGAVHLGSITSAGGVLTIGGNNWYWKPKAGLWIVLQADWSPPRICVRVDGREIIRSALLDSPSDGLVGLGTRRGTGKPAIEIDWFRIRQRYEHAPVVIVDEPEPRGNTYR
jgi:hypothetical protein